MTIFPSLFPVPRSPSPFGGEIRIQHRFNFDLTCFNTVEEGGKTVSKIAVQQNRTDVETNFGNFCIGSGDHVGVPTQSSRNRTLLLCKVFLLLSSKNVAVDYVSENQEQ